MAHQAKLLLFTHVSNTQSITGAEKMLLHLALKLSDYFQCVLVVPQAGELTRQAARYGIRTLPCRYPLVYEMYAPGPNLPQEIEQLTETAEFHHLTALMQAEQADLVLTNTCVNVLPAAAASRLGIPVIWNITEAIVRTAYFGHAQQIIDSLSDRVLVISETVRSRFQGGIPGEKLGLIYPSWEWSDYHPGSWDRLRENKRSELGVGSGHRLLGFISSFLTEEKGFEHFIDTALELCRERSDLRFLVIGQRNNKVFYKRCLDKLNETKYFSRFTFIPYEKNVEAAYCAMDILVVPSLMPEGFGLTGLEGMIHGKLTAAYQAGGLGEVLGACGFGPYLSEMGNREQLTAQIKALLDLPKETAASLSATAREQAEVHFGPAAFADRLRSEVQTWAARRPDRLYVNEADGSRVWSSETGMEAAAEPEPAPETPVPVRRRKRRRLRRLRFKYGSTKAKRSRNVRRSSSARRRLSGRLTASRRPKRAGAKLSGKSRNRLGAPGKGRRTKR
ncbi:hypothetical protein AWM70_14030 [Paenibacillus yonginensis]|uniref:Glycosyltransferase subfamily 4-like N-terminal domain-containing protein n=1 Tax=Paenibacillus yonginensis TaxID=1462996 RepID=A0A1B1N2B2_9BACL|nr:glycosyltransferase family 4 protein [Paenibacillus yonginensis]ANS75577.1 hypothetical protein AWM70_14030 [Paenibacillus yonginensis]